MSDTACKEIEKNAIWTHSLVPAADRGMSPATNEWTGRLAAMNRSISDSKRALQDQITAVGIKVGHIELALSQMHHI